MLLDTLKNFVRSFVCSFGRSLVRSFIHSSIQQGAVRQHSKQIDPLEFVEEGMRAPKPTPNLCCGVFFTFVTISLSRIYPTPIPKLSALYRVDPQCKTKSLPSFSCVHPKESVAHMLHSFLTTSYTWWVDLSFFNSALCFAISFWMSGSNPLTVTSC